MNPLQEYIAIIHTRQQNPLPEGQYGERHHIIPKSCGGPNRKWNVVKLTPEEHYKCHCLLPDIYKDGRQHEYMVRALLMMSTRKMYGVSAGEYGDLRRRFGAPNTGKKFGPHTEEWKQKVSQKLSGRPKSEEQRRQISATLMGHPSHTKGKKFGHRSAEARRKMSEAAKKRRASPETRRKMSEAQKARQERIRQERKATA